MPDFQKFQDTKEKIISIIRLQGPSLPARIARETGSQQLFVSAFLSELVSERKLKISDMKVGSSPIYFLEGQENQLENFTEYLNSKEKEALNLLKQNKILRDEEQLPAIRVALRSIKDFAISVNVKIDSEIRLFWRFFLLNQDEARELIEKSLTKQIPKQKLEEPKERKKVESKQKEISPSILEKDKKSTIIKKIIEPEFPKEIKSYLEKNSIHVMEDILLKKKEFTAKVQIETNLGKQEFYLIAKDKKKISENDIVSALQKAQAEKMPAIIVSSAELDKKAQVYLQEWKNLIKFKQIKF